MKTLLVSVLFALVGVACSSDNTSTLATSTGVGSVQQDQPCKQSSDCEAPLQCGFPLVNDAGGCPTTGVCVGMTNCTTTQVCPCGGTVMVNACVTSVYASVPVGNGTCSAAGGPSDASAGGSTTGG
jgi:hypothetical protein